MVIESLIIDYQAIMGSFIMLGFNPFKVIKKAFKSVLKIFGIGDEDGPKYDDSAAKAEAKRAAEERKKLKRKARGNAALLTGAGDQPVVGAGTRMLGG